jgi:6-phosphogluconolactonase (cycloisomerase 2 family)/glutamine cyclotransferase
MKFRSTTTKLLSHRSIVKSTRALVRRRKLPIESLEDRRLLAGAQPPEVLSVLRANVDPTNAASINYTVTFDEPVRSVDLADFQLVSGGNVSGALLTQVTPQNPGDTYNSVYTVEVNSGSGTGTLKLDVLDDDSIEDQQGDRLGGNGATNGVYSSGQTYTVDKTAPSVDSISTALPNLTNAALVPFYVAFSETVNNVDSSDFVLNTTGSITNAVISTITGTGSNYTVNVSTGTGDGMIQLGVATTPTINDVAGNALTGSGPSSQVVAIDKTGPSVVSFNRLNVSPTVAASVGYRLIFSEPVMGVGASDFVLSTTGVSGAVITSFSGNGATYEVTVARGSGEGTIAVQLSDDDSILDLTGNPLGGIGLGNGSQISEIYTIQHATIRGTVYRDYDQDGLQDLDETPMPGYAVYIDSNGNNTLDAGEATTISASDDPATTTVNETGQYSFTVNAAGTSSVRIVVPNGWLQTSPLAVSATNNTGALTASTTWFRTPDRVYPSPDGNHLYTIDTSVIASVAGYAMSLGGGATALSSAALGDAANARFVSDLAFSKDGRWVFALESLNQAAKVFSRNGSTGTLTLAATATNGVAGVTGLDGPERVTVSADERSVYIYSKTFRTLNHFVFDSVTGSLTQVQSISLGGTASLPTSALVITPDDRQVIFTDESSNSMSVYHRDAVTANLTLAQTLLGDSSDTSRFHGPTSAAITPDGRFVYVSSDAGQRINLFTRNTTTGQLTTTTVYARGTEVTHLAIDPRGVFLTETRQDASTIAVNSINPVTGALTPTQTLTDANTGNGLHRVSHVAISADGRFAFLTDPINGRMRIMSRQLGATSPSGTIATITTGNVSADPFRLFNSPPQVNSIVVSGAIPISGVRTYTINFNETVTGVDVSDFVVDTTGYTGASVASITGTGNQRTVSVNSGIGPGTMRLRLADNDSILDVGGEPLKGRGFGSGNLKDGSLASPFSIVDTIPPTVTSTVAENPIQSSLSSVSYLVGFSEPMTNILANRFSVLASGITGATVSSVTSLANNQYRVTVNTGSGNGTLRLRLIDADNIFDAANNPLNGVGTGSDALNAPVYQIERNPVRSIVGLLFNDTDRDGLRGVTESLFAGWRVYIDANLNGVRDAAELSTLTLTDDPLTTTVDETGQYRFSNLPLGTYTIRAEASSTWFTAPLSSATVTLGFGSPANTDTLVGVQANATVVRGRIVNDLDGDAIADTNESGMVGWTVFVDSNGNGTLDANEQSSITISDDPATTELDESGRFEFMGLLPGTQLIRHAMPTGYFATTSTFRSVTMASSTDEISLEFHAVLNQTQVSGRLFNDQNGNGIEEAGEGPRVGETVYVDTNNNSFRDASELWATTAADGSYVLNGVQPGTRVVRVASNFTTTSPTFARVRLFGVLGATLREYDSTTGGLITSFNVSPYQTRGIEPVGIAYDGTSVFVLDSLGNTIIVVNPDNGNVTNLLSGLPTNVVITGLAYVNGTLYAMDNPNDRIYGMNPSTGQIISTLNISTINAGNPVYATRRNLELGLGESPDGQKLVASTTTDYRLIINPTTGVIEGHYVDPSANTDQGIAGAGGRLFVSSFQANSVSVYDAGGNLQSTLNGISAADLGAAEVISQGARLTLAINQEFPDVNFAMTSRTAAISGFQYVDLNQNGVFDPSETPLAGVTVYFDANNNRVLDNGEPSTVSATDGSYTLTQVTRGTPIIRTTTVFAGAPMPSVGYQSSAVRSVSSAIYGIKPRISTYPTEVSIAQIDPLTGATFGGFTSNVTFSNISSGAFDGERFYIVDNVADKLIQLSITGQWLAETPFVGTIGAQVVLGVAIINDTIYLPAIDGGQPFQLWRFDKHTSQFVNPIPISSNTKQSSAVVALPTLSTSVSESPDGKSILLFSSLDGDQRVFILNPVTGRLDIVLNVPDSIGSETAAGVLGDEIFLASSSNSAQLKVYDSNFVFKRTIANASFTAIANKVVKDVGTAVPLNVPLLAGVNVPHQSISTMSGTVSVDSNRNGIVDPGEAISGATIYVDANRNGLLDSGEQTVASQPDGSYSFTGLPIGEHAIRILPTPGNTVRTLRIETSLYGLQVDSGVSTIIKHDAITGKVLRQFSAPGSSTNAAGLAINEHGLYYSSDGNIWRLDPETGAIRNQYATPGLSFGGLASVGGFLFATRFVFGTSSVSDTIYKLDPLSGQILATININTINGGSNSLMGGLGESASGDYLVAETTGGAELLLNPNDGTLISRSVDTFSGPGIAGAAGELFRSLGNLYSITVVGGSSNVLARRTPIDYVPYGLAAASITSHEYVVYSGYQPTYSNLDFQLTTPAVSAGISGTIWNDFDRDGSQNGGEPGLPSVRVFIDLNENGSLDPGEPNQLTVADDPATALIDETGRYSFEELTPGHYVVRQESLPSFEMTSPLGFGISEAARYASDFSFVGFSHHPDDDIQLSQSGRYLVYATTRAVLPTDTNNRRDIYWVDQQTGVHELISVNNSGQLGNSNHFEPDVSADGRYITFRTGSTNYDARDINGTHDIYLRDRQLGTTTLLTVGFPPTLNGAGGDSRDAVITPDGSHVLFLSAGPNLRSDDTNSLGDTYVLSRATGVVDRISLSSDGQQLADGNSYGGDISPDGRYVLFESVSSQVTPGDSNGASDIYWKDRQTGEIRLVSASASGQRGNAESQKRSINSDGRWVAFDSAASNLTGDPHPGAGETYQVFLKDTQTGDIKGISQPTIDNATLGVSRRPEISGDGRFVVFESSGAIAPNDTNGLVDVYLYDRLSDTYQLVSQNSLRTVGDGPSNNPVISGDGTMIAYTTTATNLGAIGAAGGIVTVKINNLLGSHTIDLQSGQDASGLNFGQSFFSGQVTGTLWYDADGNGSFDLNETRLPNRTVYLDTNHNAQLDAGEPTTVTAQDNPSTTTNNEAGEYLFTGLVAGNYELRQLTLPGWDQTFPDIQSDNTVQLVAVSGYISGTNTPFFQMYDAAASDAGRFIAFSTDSPLSPLDTNQLTDVYVTDRMTGLTEPVSVTASGTTGNWHSLQPSISGDGRYVVFRSAASDIASPSSAWYNIYMRDRLLDVTTLISKALGSSTAANTFSISPQISRDGKTITFWSNSSDLVADDTNLLYDIFAFDVNAQSLNRINVGPGGIEPIGGNSFESWPSADGRYIGYWSHATNQVIGDTNAAADVFLLDRQTGTTQRVSVKSDGTQGNGSSDHLSLSDDGRFIAFQSNATNLTSDNVTGLKQIFLKDMLSGSITLVSKPFDGTSPNGQALFPTISGNGRYISYYSDASNLIGGDTNGVPDVFVYDQVLGTTRSLSRSPSGELGNAPSDYARMSRDGSVIVFNSAANNLVVSPPTLGSLYAVSLDTDPGSFVFEVTSATRNFTSAFGSRSKVDLGDAPATYGVSAEQNGPRHIVVPNVHLGAAVGIDADTGQPDTDVEDDGLDFKGVLAPGLVLTADVTASTAGVLAAWIDFNANGAFDANERQHFAIGTAGTQTTTLIQIPVPSTAITGSTAARFRFSTDATSVDLPTGPAPDGEVEDYTVQILAPPTNIALSATSISENVSTSASDLLFASLIADDTTVNDRHTYSLVGGQGDTDNGSFTIISDQLFVKQGVALDYETKSIYNIRLRTTDLSGLTFEKAISLSVNNIAPAVTGLYVRGSGWNSGYLNTLAIAGVGTVFAGFRLLTGANQIANAGLITWQTINQVSATFNEPVNVNANSLRLLNSTNSDLPLAANGFVYDTASRTARWTLAAPITRGKFLVSLEAATITDGTAALDGEWITSVDSYATGGNGTQGGDLNFRFNYLPGDVTLNGQTNAGDVNAVKNSGAGAPNAINFRRDLTANNQINAGDVNFVSGLGNRSLSGIAEPLNPPPPRGGLPVLAQNAARSDQPARVLTQAELTSISSAAIDIWAAHGLTAKQVERLRLVPIVIGDLGPGQYLGMSFDNRIVIDDDASGWGWFVDSTPKQNEEFVRQGKSESYEAHGGRSLVHQMDLLSVVLHEMGHQLDLDDDHSDSNGTSLMAARLKEGTRRLPGKKA